MVDKVAGALRAAERGDKPGEEVRSTKTLLSAEERVSEKEEPMTHGSRRTGGHDKVAARTPMTSMKASEGASE
ncbi:hypothetical protein F443_22762, partial [Phytophthora nicotianae P1569]